MFDKYTRTARLYPAIICSVPIFILNFFLLQSYATDFIASLAAAKWIGGATLYLALTYLISQIGRFIGKEVFEKSYFKDELYMPTTNFLLHSDDTYSSEYKVKIHDKIYIDFNLRIHSAEKENQDNSSARRVIVEAISMVRGKVKNGRLLLQHNIEYGFIRNLIGGSVIALVISIINLLVFTQVFPNHVAFSLTLITGFVYLIFVLLSKYLIKSYGVRYAKIIIQEYVLLPRISKHSK